MPWNYFSLPPNPWVQAVTKTSRRKRSCREEDEICPFLSPTKACPAGIQPFRAPVGSVKTRLCKQARNVLVPSCHSCWWHLLLASMDSNNIPTTMSSTGVQQDFKDLKVLQDFKIDSTNTEFCFGISSLQTQGPPHSPICSAKAHLLHSPEWHLS